MMCVLYYLVSILLFASTRSSILRDDFQSKTMSTRSEGPEESYSNDMYLATNTDDESLKKLSKPVYEERVRPLIDKMKSFKRRLDNFVEEIRSKHKKRRRDHDRWSSGRTSTHHHYYDHDRSYETSKSDKDDDWRSSKYKDRSERYYDEKDRDFSYDRSYDYQEPYLYQEGDNYGEHHRQSYDDYEPESKSESRKESYQHDSKDGKHDDKEQYSSDYSNDGNNAENDDYRYGDTANYDDDNYDDYNYNSADYGSDSREEKKKDDHDESARKSQIGYDDDGYDKSYTGGKSKEQSEEDDEDQYEGDDRYERYNKYDYKKDRTVSSFADDFGSSDRLKEDYNPYGYRESSSVDQRSESVPEVKTEFVNPANIIPL